MPFHDRAQRTCLDSFALQKLQDAKAILRPPRPQGIGDDMLGPEQPGSNVAAFKADRDLPGRFKRLSVSGLATGRNCTGHPSIKILS
jgi:hypothetical protein